MKKLFFIAMLLVFAASISFAQTAHAGAYARVRVLGTLNLQVGTPDTLDFGDVTAGGDVSINAQTDLKAVPFHATSSRSGWVQVTYSSTVLSGHGTMTISWDPSLYGNSANNQGGSSPVNNGDWVHLGTGSNHDYYFWLGGTAHVQGTEDADTYVGTFTLTVTY